MNAVDVAHEIVAALFDGENREETDRAAEIRATREAELTPPEVREEPEVPRLRPEGASRRAVLTGGLSQPEAET